jgi:tRNA(adenine34) deaminase
MNSNHHRFMELALQQAKQSLQTGNLPVGSVIVKAESVVGTGRNLASSLIDPTAHAEMVAIRDACSRLKTTDLSGCICYTTVEPCPMCCWAILVSGITQIVLGARFSRLKKVKTGNYTTEHLLQITGRHCEVIDGIRAEECVELRNKWVDPKAP